MSSRSCALCCVRIALVASDFLAGIEIQYLPPLPPTHPPPTALAFASVAVAKEEAAAAEAESEYCSAFRRNTYHALSHTLPPHEFSALHATSPSHNFILIDR